MLKMRKMVMVVMMVICLLMAMTISVNASSDNPITIENLEMDNNAFDNTTTNTENTENTENTNSQIINTNTNTNGNTLPKTGVTEDITVMFFIVVCVISSIYAYRKIRDYNI